MPGDATPLLHVTDSDEFREEVMINYNCCQQGEMLWNLKVGLFWKINYNSGKEKKKKLKEKQIRNNMKIVSLGNLQGWRPC